MREDIAQLARALTDSGATASVAESCTAGGLAYALTTVPGSSHYFVGGILAYANEVKCSLLNVKQATLDTFGAVSAEVAEEMANGCRRRFETDFALSITGIAGPDGGTDAKPVGLIYIGLASAHETSSRRYRFTGSRDEIRKASIHAAIRFLHEAL